MLLKATDSLPDTIAKKTYSSAITSSGLNGLNEGDELVFEVTDGPKGLSAVNLKNA